MKNYIPKTVEAITEFLSDLSDVELVKFHNEYCQSAQMDSDEIYDNDAEFFNTFFENKIIDAVRAAQYGDYRFTDEWVKFNGYENLESFSRPSTEIDINAIAEDILENEQNYSDIELEEVMEEESE